MSGGRENRKIETSQSISSVCVCLCVCASVCVCVCARDKLTIISPSLSGDYSGADAHNSVLVPDRGVVMVTWMSDGYMAGPKRLSPLTRL